MATRPTTFSMRMPQDLNEKIQEYAAEHNCTKAEAMSHFARAGIDLEENGPAASPAPQETLNKIQERLEALQNLPVIEPVANEQATAIVPVDIRDKIQAYSAEHACSEQEALAYYARIGVQMTSEQRPASTADIAMLTARLDALAQDSAAKNEQLKQMSEILSAVRDYTKPDELELEGEVADEAEDVEPPELTDEERQRIADEHTRQIVSDVMGNLLSEQQKREAEAESRRQAMQTPAVNPWIPVLVAVIVSLIIGLVVILNR
ncbi:MAG: hypothetical protein Q4B54_00770 [Coriobacteriales bacterium]|nr:hypothetical protein [Coriobacteriales bacterium]